MKLALVSLQDATPFGGADELWVRMVHEALAGDDRVHLCVKWWPRVDRRIKDLKAAGASLHLRRYPRAELATKLLRRAKILSPAGRYGDVARFQADVVCVAQGGTYDFTRHPQLVRLLADGQTPYVVVCQYNDDVAVTKLKGREQAAQFLLKAARVVFVSQRNLCQAQRQLACRLPNAMVICNPHRLGDCEFAAWPPPEMARFASVARLDVVTKGQDVLFEALAQERWQARDWQLGLYGTGSNEDYLKELAVFYGIAERVKFHGYIRDVRQIWAENHLLLMPSRGEGTPLALLEAMACGRPAVVTDVGGNIEWVAEGRNGFVAGAPTPSLFGDALERAWQQRETWKSLGLQAREDLFARIDMAPEKTLLDIVVAAARPRPLAATTPAVLQGATR